ncbi:type III pantothenate kinase [Rhabdobacter roseus]|uniref:Type III pantothenate kinase n=1 Tax=Rhabdobacter roseus TaxID=1655419 RepID=A0A840TSL5_9BACT|nr:type III pantothenate kinase [Rhabdobacter roseus]MBB5286941.1 type III pantothenate kinase [Rhabdobacter roseus]
MNIVVDSGNTYSKIGWFSESTLLRYQTQLSFEALVELIRQEPPKYLLYSSVSRSTEAFLEALGLNIPVLSLSAHTPVPILKNYDTPHTLGADRIAAAVGGTFLFPDEDLVVIDMGTCITYDYVTRMGTFEGGLISPGLRMRFRAMHSFTQRLPLVEPDGIPPLIGKSTHHAMQSGVMHGLLAEIEGIIAAYRQISPHCRVLACGGDVPFFESRLKPTIFAVPELVLIGLNRILQHNVALQQD